MIARDVVHYSGEDPHTLARAPRVSMTLDMTAAEADEALASYDPTSSTSPSAADSRKIARTVLDALAAAAGSV